MNRDVSINVENESITKVLDKLFKDTNIKYVIDGSHVVLSAKETVSRRLSLKPRNVKKISGVVTDENGELIIGANVIIKGTTIGTITDVDGAFTLDVAQGDVVEVRYVGDALNL
jgi:uncharacterized protein (DUF1015 family)